MRGRIARRGRVGPPATCGMPPPLRRRRHRGARGLLHRGQSSPSLVGEGRRRVACEAYPPSSSPPTYTPYLGTSKHEHFPGTHAVRSCPLPGSVLHFRIGCLPSLMCPAMAGKRQNHRRTRSLPPRNDYRHRVTIPPGSRPCNSNFPPLACPVPRYRPASPPRAAWEWDSIELALTPTLLRRGADRIARLAEQHDLTVRSLDLSPLGDVAFDSQLVQPLAAFVAALPGCAVVALPAPRARRAIQGGLNGYLALLGAYSEALGDHATLTVDQPARWARYDTGTARSLPAVAAGRRGMGSRLHLRYESCGERRLGDHRTAAVDGRAAPQYPPQRFPSSNRGSTSKTQPRSSRLASGHGSLAARRARGSCPCARSCGSCVAASTRGWSRCRCARSARGPGGRRA